MALLINMAGSDCWQLGGWDATRRATCVGWMVFHRNGAAQQGKGWGQRCLKKSSTETNLCYLLHNKYISRLVWVIPDQNYNSCLEYLATLRAADLNLLLFPQSLTAFKPSLLLQYWGKLKVVSVQVPFVSDAGTIWPYQKMLTCWNDCKGF